MVKTIYKKLIIFFSIFFLIFIFSSKPSFSYSYSNTLLLELNIECSGKNVDWSKSWNNNFFAISAPYTLQGSRYWIAKGADEGNKKYDGDIGQNIFIGTKTKKNFIIKGDGTWLKNKSDGVFKFKFISKGNKSIIEHLTEGVEGTGGKGKHKRECIIKLINSIEAFKGARLEFLKKDILERDKKIELLSNQIDIYKKENDERIKANDLSNEIISSWDESVDNETNNTLKNAVDICKKEKKYSFIWYYNKCDTKKID